MPLRQVNIYSATTEELFERLDWFYTSTVNQVQVYDAEGHSHLLSDLVRLSRGYIPFPPCFALQNDFVQNQPLLQSLKVQNVCCTFEGWGKLWRIPASMFDQRDGKGQWPFLSMEGSQLRTDLSASLSRLNKLKKLPYSLEISNQKIGIFLERVIDSLPLPNRDTLSSAFQLQQVEIVLKNALHSQKGEITTRLREYMRMRIFDFNPYLLFKKKIAVACHLWEGNLQKQQDQDSIEWTQQPIK